jgi:hypothetical protein
VALNFCTCQSGYVNTQQDSPSSCEPCGPGYFCHGGMHRQQCLPSQTTESDTAGNVSQCLCSSGAFLGAEACEPCAAGRYKSSIGNDACEKCAAGKWSNTTGAVDAATCVNCITGSTTETDGSAGEESCVRPETGQVAACVSGRVCLIDPLSGFGLRSGHRVVITSSDCASAKLAVARVSDNGMSKPSMNGRQYIWGNVPGDFLPEGGSYNLCWCAGMGALSCADIRINFWLAAGQLEVAGPLENSFECIRGEDCVDLGPFQGYGLSESDKVAARRGQCGGQQSLALSTAPAHLNGVGQLQAATDGSLPFLGFGASSPEKGEDLRLTVDADEGFLLCWCGDADSAGACDRPEAYAVPAGSLRIVGPRTNQEGACAIGQSCAIQVQGIGLQPLDRLMILVGCGHGSFVEGFPGGGIAETQAGGVFGRLESKSF